MGIEIDGGKISIEKIMKEIREKIEKKKRSGFYSDEDTKSEFVSGSLYRNSNKQTENIESCLDVLEELQDPRADSLITSHRPKTGPFIIFTKKIIREIFKYFGITNIFLSRQAEFNNQLLKLLNYLAIDFNVELPAKNNPLVKQIMEIRQENILLKARLDRVLTEIEKKYDLPEKGAINLIQEKNNLMDHNYFLFEKTYRGEEKEIKKRLEIYLPVFHNLDNVLDIGCGRGEFLEILKKEGVKTVGIDQNEDMIYTCKEKNLDVKQIDAVTYLESIKDHSLGGIFASHVIEHFNINLLIEFIKLCFCKLRQGGCFVLETPNPLSIIVSSINFHLDISHVKPIHPEALKFLMEANGFVNVQVKYLSPFPDEMKLQTLTDLRDTLSKKSLKLMNENTQKLNNLLFGYQDYAVICKKQGQLQ